jgi:beta-hydroxylase
MNNLLLFIIIIFILLLIFSNNNENENFTEVSNTEGAIITVYPQKKDCYFDQKEIYPQLNVIHENRDIIMKELFDIKNKDPNLWHIWIENQLSVIPLYFFGKWSKKGMSLFPNTSKIIKNIPKIKTVAISKLKPQSQIQPHIGWGELANGILRCHYGLIVPHDSGCVCDNWVVLHKDGEWLVFDDAKMHSSYNFSDEDRIIIIIDMERPSHIKPGTSTVAYKKELLDFINSFYDQSDITDIRNDLQL